MSKKTPLSVTHFEASLATPTSTLEQFIITLREKKSTSTLNPVKKDLAIIYRGEELLQIALQLKNRSIYPGAPSIMLF